MRTQDTINIYEWGGVFEHNKNRRGIVTFGETADPALVPTSGSASYIGVVHGRYSGNGSDDPVPFVCAARNRSGQLGLVVGATFPREVERVRELAPTLPLLIPGIGAQGGDGSGTRSPIIVNSSRGALCQRRSRLRRRGASGGAGCARRTRARPHRRELTRTSAS